MEMNVNMYMYFNVYMQVNVVPWCTFLTAGVRWKSAT